MNKRAVSVGILAAVIAAVLWFLLVYDTAVAPSVHDIARPGSSGSVKQNKAAVVSETFAGTGSFTDLVGLGKDLQCDFSYVSDTTNAAVAGVVKVSGSNIRSDFEMQQAGETYDSHLIQSGQYTYSWTESEVGTVAVRINMDEAPSNERPVVMDSKVDYNCQAWTADISVFVPPSDLEFLEPQDFGLENEE